ncbi:class I SAM-dependent methyltransferase [Homoserinimonas sp. OAct 916]|uniref:class I SAM-dependent methyltransferase n=1 Tax=Homoserinimonas sp. OAct 916 TaxID=2211450 RepID=UPI0013006B03|nr:class I SAM-dependent methyltransferase [Homoserinimonas sp. OAct 916]
MNSDQWDARYRDARTASGDSLWVAEAPLRFQQVLADVPPGSALDLATGDGRTALWLAGVGWDTTAVDFSGEALVTARTRAAERGANVHWIQGDVTDWEPGRTFDLVTIGYLHLPREAMAAVLKRAAGWLADGGRLLVLGHDVRNVDVGAPGPRDPGVLYTPEILREAVGEVLVILECETVERDGSADAEVPDAPAHVALDTLLHAQKD